MRAAGIYNIEMKDNYDNGSVILEAQETQISRSFSITNQQNERINYLIGVVYFFLTMLNEKIISQMVGKNTIESGLSKITKCHALEGNKSVLRWF